jgi:hypothetical protein
MVPEGLKGIQRDPTNLTGTMGQITSYIEASDGEANASVRSLMEKSKKEISSIFEEVNKLYAEDISQLTNKVKASQTNLFKEYKPIEMKQ